MPSNRLHRRRDILASTGLALMTGLAGCAGWLPGSPAEMDVTTYHEDGELIWEFPPDSDGTPDDDLLDGLGYAAVTPGRRPPIDATRRELRLICTATVGSISESGMYAGYKTDWFRFHLGPPPDYEGMSGFEMYAEPPGQWRGLASWYDRRSGRRTFSLALRHVETDGTIQIPVLFRPGGSPLPDRLRCAFRLQASSGDPVGKTFRVGDHGTLPLTDTADT